MPTAALAKPSVARACSPEPLNRTDLGELDSALRSLRATKGLRQADSTSGEKTLDPPQATSYSSSSGAVRFADGRNSPVSQDSKEIDPSYHVDIDLDTTQVKGVGGKVMTLQEALAPAPAAPPSEAEELWMVVKGLAQVAVPVLAILDPPVAVALTAAIAVADAIVTIIQQIDGDTSTLQANLDTISKAALVQAAPGFRALPPQQVSK